MMRSRVSLLFLSCLFITGNVWSIEAQKIPRNKPKPGIEHQRGGFHQLPRTLISRSTSPTKRYVAQVMHALPGPVYYLAIIDNEHSRRLYVDEHLIAGSHYPHNKIKVSWKDEDTILIKARHKDGKTELLLNYNLQTAQITRLEQAIPAKPAKKKVVQPRLTREINITSLDDRMYLARQIPLGVGYTELKKSLPAIGPLKPDAGKNLSEAFLAIDALGYAARVEFNFRNNILYGFYYLLPPMEKQKAEKAYLKLAKYYSQQLGSYREEFVQEKPGYAVKQAIWEKAGRTSTIVQNISSGKISLTWSVR